MTTAFEWRANPQGPGQNEEASTAEGCLFATDPSTAALTLISPKPATAASTEPYHPSPGDDLSPPNSCQAHNLNGIAVPVSASAGWSTTPPRDAVYPSRTDYELQLQEDDSLQLTVILEYTNPFPKESMMVKVAVAKTVVSGDSELTLCGTQFQECVMHDWVEISADVDYTMVAKQVVEQVLQDANAGQTAGMATITADTIDLTLGPFSEKARLILTFQAASLYSYQAMSVSADAADVGSHRLLPLFVVLPFAPLDHEGGISGISVRLSAPRGTVLLPLDQDAYGHLKQQEPMRSTTILAVPKLVPQPNDRVGYELRWESLPPRSCGVLAWLALANLAADDFVDVGREFEMMNVATPAIRAVVQVPSQADAVSLQVPLPGHGPMGSLYRVHVSMPKAQQRQKPLFLLNLTLSDKSGSTCRQVSTGKSMRHRFNELAEVRFLKRLESIPALVHAGVLRLDDVWMDAFLAFDGHAPESSIHRISFRVGDVIDSIVAVVKALRSSNDAGASRLPNVLQHVRALRSVTTGGTTDFSAGPRTIVMQYANWKNEAMAMISGQADTCTFVEFDTDGGHNGAYDYIDSLQRLCDVCHVKNGVVTGFGSWLNQDCASQVAGVLGSVPAQLTLQVPEPGHEGLNLIFRRGFSAWINALRQPPPFTVKVSAGSVSFSFRTANAVEVLGLRRVGHRREPLPKFGPPDVSNEAYTATVIEEVASGDELVLYLVSRLDNARQLAGALDIQSTTASTSPVSNIRATTRAETSVSNFIAFDWLSMLSKHKGFQLSPLMDTSLSTRLEDEVSFRFNVASPSGRTSYLGRSKTVANRAAIDSVHQPNPPTPPIRIVHSPSPKYFPGTPFGASSDAFSCGAAPSYGALVPQARRSAGFSTRGPGGFGGAAPSFGSSAPTRSSRFGGSSIAASSTLGISASASNGGLLSAGTPAPFGSSTSTQTGFFTPRAPGMGYVTEKSDKMLWIDAMTTPVGSCSPFKQDYGKLQDAIREVAHCRQRLRHDPSISHFCDICKAQFLPGHARFHCFDCDDFDVCAYCKSSNSRDHFGPMNHPLLQLHANSLHRLHDVSSTQPVSQISNPPEDPLVGSLLQTTQTSQSPNTAPDRAMVLSTLRIKRFLLSVLHWWPLFRATCPFRYKLPLSVPYDLAQKLSHCTNTDAPEDLLATVTIVIDSIMREHESYTSK